MEACFIAWEQTWALEQTFKICEDVNLLEILMENSDFKETLGYFF